MQHTHTMKFVGSYNPFFNVMIDDC